jgi:hypothetical protein
MQLRPCLGDNLHLATEYALRPTVAAFPDLRVSTRPQGFYVRNSSRPTRQQGYPRPIPLGMHLRGPASPMQCPRGLRPALCVAIDAASGARSVLSGRICLPEPHHSGGRTVGPISAGDGSPELAVDPQWGLDLCQCAAFGRHLLSTLDAYTRLTLRRADVEGGPAPTMTLRCGRLPPARGAPVNFSTTSPTSRTLRPAAVDHRTAAGSMLTR